MEMAFPEKNLLDIHFQVGKWKKKSGGFLVGNSKVTSLSEKTN